MAPRNYRESPSVYTALGERIARLESENDGLNAAILEMRADVKAILAQMNQQTGGRRALWALLSAAGALGGLVASGVAWLLHLRV